MLLHGMLTFCRMLSRHRLYAVLNIGGLGLGIAVFLLLSLVVRYEYGYDRFWPDQADIYRLDQLWAHSVGVPGDRTDFSTYRARDALRAEFPQIRASSRLIPQQVTLIAPPSDLRNGGARIMESEQIQFVDPELPDVLALPVIDGQRAEALAAPDRIVLSARLARKYFGTIHAVGRTMRMVVDGSAQTYVVSAVFRDLPLASTYRIDAAAPIPERIRGRRSLNLWAAGTGVTLLRFSDRMGMQAVAARLGDFIARHSNDAPTLQYTRGFALTPLADMHFRDATAGADRDSVLALGIVGVLALLAATINYVNLATARAMLRAREVAMRKTLGASRALLTIQFLGEAVAMVALAALLGLALTELALPPLNMLCGWQVAISYGWLLPRLTLLVVVAGVGAGLYPALVLAAYAPARILAAARMPSMGRMGTRIRAILVGAQFVFAIGFAICALVIDLQVAHLRDADRGFRRDGLIIVSSMADDALRPRQQALLDSFAKLPGVRSVTQSDRAPGNDLLSMQSVWRPGAANRQQELVQQHVGRDYFRTYATPLLAGRLFDDAHGTDIAPEDRDDPRASNIVINRSAAAALGFASPDAAIGRPVTAQIGTGTAPRTIIGVVADARFGSGTRPVEPQFYYYQPGIIGGSNAAIRFAGPTERAMLAALARGWRQLVPDIQFDAASADDRLARFYQPDQRRGQLFTAGAVVAIAISCLGLYGLSAFNATRRLGEIGIRKTLGAGTADVLRLLLVQFIRPVAVSALVAWPVAWLAMRTWLAGFDQRIALSPLYFLAVTLGAVALAAATVLGQTIRVARAEPARALRHD
ncbi:ABC transporter permease [Nguyenibacter sp. L1]|uniref:ABC transporter permease n=1 Tax=Nguyenibacter sp. L1 TaxID=3049350 RepID=UPI002B466892|nr:ABC transporter permease [Nguyenibacter sp. L1]WRH89448.1 ABC transporter permease [Nguyenibacter sp. L1]